MIGEEREEATPEEAPGWESPGPLQEPSGGGVWPSSVPLPTSQLYSWSSKILPATLLIIG
jgi:hypothetical protein